MKTKSQVMKWLKKEHRINVRSFCEGLLLPIVQPLVKVGSDVRKKQAFSYMLRESVGVLIHFALSGFLFKAGIERTLSHSKRMMRQANANNM